MVPYLGPAIVGTFLVVFGGLEIVFSHRPVTSGSNQRWSYLNLFVGSIMIAVGIVLLVNAGMFVPEQPPRTSYDYLSPQPNRD